jgi:glycerophosphoryl diester phosphodiesterase
MSSCLLLLLTWNAMTATPSQPAEPSAPTREPAAAAELVASPRVLVIAHRGDSGAFPENTLTAFRSAVDLGADLVELDYYHSADGVPFVFHDRTLNRTSNATAVFGREKIPTGSLPWQDLQRLDAGAWFDARFQGTPIPTLAEALDGIQQGSVTLVERKEGDAATCVQLLREKNLLTRVVVQSFDWEYLAECHRLAPELILGALGGKELSDERLDQIQKAGARVVGWDHRDLEPEQIQAVQRRGLRIWAYTVNDAERAQQLIEAGIDGIITDYPAKIMQLRR